MLFTNLSHLSLVFPSHPLHYPLFILRFPTLLPLKPKLFSSFSYSFLSPSFLHFPHQSPPADNLTLFLVLPLSLIRLPVLHFNCISKSSTYPSSSHSPPTYVIFPSQLPPSYPRTPILSPRETLLASFPLR